MKIFEILKVPHLKEGSPVPEIMRSLVLDAATLACDEVLFEVIVQGGEHIGDPLQWFITLRSMSKSPQQRDLVEKILTKSIEEAFRRSGYIIEPRTREEYEEVCKCECEIVRSLVKEHSVYRANLSPMPYVLRPDLFKSSFDEVLSLLDGSGVQLIFQICPTRLIEEEGSIIRERSVSYLNAAQMLMNHDQVAADAANNWTELTEEGSTPYALCGIFIRGSHEASAGVAARMKGCYRQMNGSPVLFNNLNFRHRR